MFKNKKWLVALLLILVIINTMVFKETVKASDKINVNNNIVIQMAQQFLENIYPEGNLVAENPILIYNTNNQYWV